jgi:hypothetical protein
MAETEGFQVADHRESIAGEFPAQVLEWLNRIPDFRRGYELNPELNAILQEAGISGDFGTGGLRPEQWPEFGPVQKTLAEFKEAYDAFRDDMLKLFMEVAATQPVTARRKKADVRRAG